jgi:hypothetical protein
MRAMTGGTCIRTARAAFVMHKIARRSHLFKPSQSGLHNLRYWHDRGYSRFGRLGDIVLAPGGDDDESDTEHEAVGSLQATDANNKEFKQRVLLLRLSVVADASNDGLADIAPAPGRDDESECSVAH